MTMFYCNLCTKNGEEFEVPADEIGVAIMRQHLADKHDVKVL